MTTDVNGTVVAIQGTAVSTTAPTDGQVLTYVSADSKWEPKPNVGAAPMYGYAYNGSQTISGSAATWQQLALGTTGPSNNTSYSSNNIVATNSGVVQVIASVYVNNADVENGAGSLDAVAIYQNGSLVDQSVVGYGLISNGQVVGGQGIQLTNNIIVSCSASDTFGVYLYKKGAQLIYVSTVSLSVVAIG